MKNIRCEVMVASAILFLGISVPFLQVQMVAAKKHHSDDESSDVGSDDQSSDQQSSDQDSGPSLTDKICHALNSGAGPALIPLLHTAGIATGGTLNAAIAAATIYCAAHGG
jgi:hypothetical protein